MDTYRLNLSWSELDSLKAAAQAAINDLEKCHLGDLWILIV